MNLSKSLVLPIQTRIQAELVLGLAQELGLTPMGSAAERILRRLASGDSRPTDWNRPRVKFTTSGYYRIEQGRSDANNLRSVTKLYSDLINKKE